MQCPQCGASLRKNGIKVIAGEPVQQWRGHRTGCRARGRQPINASAMSQTERDRRAYGRQPRQITYALFRKDCSSICGGKITKRGFVRLEVGYSRKSIERENPDYWAIPVSQLSAKEKRWIE